MARKSKTKPAPAPEKPAPEAPPTSVGTYIVDTVETLAVAVVFALFIKFFVIEAFRIPSSSMEPTLIGSGALSDKILVAKNHYMFFGEPQRWDVSVFKYPNNRARAYIKRIVGMGGDWLLVRDGDALDCPPGEDGAPGEPRPFERPDRRVVDSMCYPLFPVDASLSAVLHRGVVNTQKLSECWQAAPPSRPADFQFQMDAISFRPTETPSPEGAVEEWIRYAFLIDNRLDSSGGEVPANDARVGVEDIQLAFDLSLPSPARVEGGVLTTRVQATFALDVDQGKAWLSVRDPGDEAGDGEIVGSEHAAKVACDRLKSGESVRVHFEHIDFQLRLYLDNELAGQLSYPPRRKDLESKNIQVRMGASGPATFASPYLARDIYYSAPVKGPASRLLAELGLIDAQSAARASTPGVFVNHPFLVPEGHFVMMGDNSSNSADSRHWHVVGYLEEDGTARVFEDASYALAEGRAAASDSPRYDIFGRVFTPSPDRAMKDAEGKPILLRYHLVDGELVAGFTPPLAEGERTESGRPFIDMDGNRRLVRQALELSAFVFTDQRTPSGAIGEATGDSFMLVGIVDRKPAADGTIGALVPSPGYPNGLRQIRVPAGFVLEEHPYLVWSPFVTRSQLLGKAFAVFWPAGIWSGKIRGLSRFSYIR